MVVLNKSRYKRCLLCGKFYWPIRIDQKYCDRCKGTKKYYIPEPIIKKRCAECHITFPTRRANQLFCSDKCRYSFHSNKIKKHKICRHCKNPFTTTNNKREYCCTNHYIKAKHLRDHKNYIVLKEKFK